MICPHCKEVIVKKPRNKKNKKDKPFLKVVNEPTILSFN
jgi:hypothetical protein